MKRTLAQTHALILVSAVLLAACEEEPRQVIEQVRAIKTITVTEVASGQVRKYSGIVQATDTSALSFEVGGNVKEVKVNLGSRVKKGQVLAVLDKQPYMLGVQAAEAALSKSQADREKDKLEYHRKKTLYEKEWVAKSAYDQALAAYESAKSAVKYSTSQLNLAKRDLRKTVIYAPFNGVIAKKAVEPHVQVRPGQKLFEINAEGALEVAIDIPETVISQVTVGTPVSVAFPTEQGAFLKGRVTEVGKVAGQANAFPVKVSLIDPPAKLRSGMTAEATFTFSEEGEESGYLIPLSAIAPGEETRQGYVFVYEPQTSTVRKTRVRARDVRENLVIIREGLKAGDIIAVAGVSFLYDDQKVKLMKAQ